MESIVANRPIVNSDFSHVADCLRCAPDSIPASRSVGLNFDPAEKKRYTEDRFSTIRELLTGSFQGQSQLKAACPVIRVGTSGFSYDDWMGPVYPEGLPRREQLSYYAREFSTVEINATFYHIPGQRTIEGWVQKTPPGFLFSVKAYQGLTHEREHPDYAGFVMSLRPLVESGKLGCVLAQFPNSFHASSSNREYLHRLRLGLGELPVVIELRNADWVTDMTLDLLRQLDFGFCCVDEPRLPGLVPPVAAVTGRVAYVRFHGRNSAKWYNHREAWERYDYTYRIEELREWVPKVHRLEASAPLTLVYFNNHFAGQAVRGARDLGQLLLEAE